MAYSIQKDKSVILTLRNAIILPFKSVYPVNKKGELYKAHGEDTIVFPTHPPVLL